ncbi:MAG TPA: hypothetical protein VGV85_05995 [Longimicrobiaceae bacterium]|nr:hypothetical protein [Longimicrobiaceae bacterium]
MSLSAADVALIRAAASLAGHAPEKMRAAHLAPRLEELAQRIAAGLPRPAPDADAAGGPGPGLLRAA